MSASDNARPIIIKKKKVSGGGGHHGGAWKVAYADFVTAMMAFFMLMWLLNATTEKQRKGIADYFNPTIPINRISGGGDGAFGGESVFSEDQNSQSGSGASAAFASEKNQARGQHSAKDNKDSSDSELEQVARNIEKALMGVGGESMVSEQLARHIVTRVTDEGLIVEFFDLENEPLFKGETAQATELTQEIVKMVARVFGLVSNDVALNGHTRAYPEMMRKIPIWELSMARSDTIRMLLDGAGFPAKRVERVTGFADRRLSKEPPLSVRNNRIELILLRN